MNDTEWFQGKSVSHQIGYIARVGIMVLVGIVLLALAFPAKAQPLASATAGGITVTIYTEACTVPGVSNLKYRATWVEGSKSYEGCWGAHPQYGIVMMYFSDQSVVMLPGEAFQKMTGV